MLLLRRFFLCVYFFFNLMTYSQLLLCCCRRFFTFVLRRFVEGFVNYESVKKRFLFNLNYTIFYLSLILVPHKLIIVLISFTEKTTYIGTYFILNFSIDLCNNIFNITVVCNKKKRRLGKKNICILSLWKEKSHGYFRNHLE